MGYAHSGASILPWLFVSLCQDKEEALIESARGPLQAPSAPRASASAEIPAAKKETAAAAASLSASEEDASRKLVCTVTVETF